MKKQTRGSAGRGLIGLVVLSAVVLGARGDLFDRYTPRDKEYYLTEQLIAFIRPGFDLQIMDVQLGEDRRPVVTFSIADPEGLPLDLNGVFTPGPVTVRFIIASIPEGEFQYVNYNIRTRTSSSSGLTVEQATTDSGGTFAKVDDGVYAYTFGNALPEGYDRNATHTIGIYANRDLREFDLERYVDNELYTFVPAGGEVTVVRDVVRTENCNQCHNPLAIHGGQRRETGLCVLCHTPQSTDADTGNTVDFKVMIHKIHRGEDLPSVEAGTPYRIGNDDFSEIAFPQDIRNCDKCHGGTTQGGAESLRPSRAACGACHDDVNFMTGENHPGGPAISDNFCAQCHYPEGELEFDASIRGAHTIPRLSRQLAGLNIELVDVSGTSPGDHPTVFFRVTNDDGTPVNPADLNFFNVNLAGPTIDYSTLIRESARTASAPFEDGFTYTFEGTIPEDAEGTFVIGAEGYRNVVLNPGTTKEMQFRETEEENPVFYFAVTDATPEPRRQVVAEEKCNACHEKLALHGSIRHDPEYCVTCHIPSGTDEAQRPMEEFPVQSRHFKFMIHRIHRGHDLSRDFTIYGFGGNPHNYNELHFPGDLRDCETCHVNDSYEIPLPEGLLSTVAPREFYSPITPIAAACLGCHDSLDAAAHAATMTAPFGEACAACHGEDGEFSVERVHAR